MDSNQIYNLLLTLKDLPVSRKIAKLRKHADDEDLQYVFKLALDKSITFGITSKAIHTRPKELPWPSLHPMGITFSDQTKLLLDDLQHRRISGQAAEQAVQKEWQRLHMSSATLLERILDRNLNCGVGAKTALKVWPELFHLHEVMLAKRFEAHRCKFPCLVEPKIDGTRATFVNGQLLTRRGIPIRSCDHIIKELTENWYPWADGELVVPGLEFFSQSDGLIRSYTSCPHAVFNIFALGKTWEMVSARQKLARKTGDSCVRFISGQVVHSVDEIMQLDAQYRAEGYEGAMVKQIHDGKLHYTPKRSYEWMKVKPQHDEEFTCVGLFEGEGKYKGMLGAIAIEYKGQLNKVGTGFTDEERLNFWTDPDMIVGNQVTVEWMEETVDGNLRHSRFKGIRWDK